MLLVSDFGAFLGLNVTLVSVFTNFFVVFCLFGEKKNIMCCVAVTSFFWKSVVSNPLMMKLLDDYKTRCGVCSLRAGLAFLLFSEQRL